MRQLHDYKGKFLTIERLKDHICKELKSEFPCHASIDIGYFEGRQSLKIWIVSQKDLDAMYTDVKANSWDMFSVPQLRLWARIIHCGTYAVYASCTYDYWFLADPSKE